MTKQAALRRTRDIAAIFVGCFSLYFVVLEAFYAIPACNTSCPMRPAAGISPTLGLFFGAPGILGCSAANMASDFIHGEPIDMLVPYFLVQVIYNAIPYCAWYFVFRKNPNPYPRFSSAGKTGLFLVLALVDSLVTCGILTAMDSTIAEPFRFWSNCMLNDMLFTFYLGMPLLRALEASPFTPRPPQNIRVPYVKQANSMTQRLLMIFVVVATAVMVVLVGATLFIAHIPDTGEAIRFTYLCAAIFTVTVLAPMLAFMHFVEKKITLPVERLTESANEFLDTLRDRGQGAPCDVEVCENGIAVENEMRELFDATNAMRHDLLGYIDQLNAAATERERAATELDIARRIQMGAVPCDFTEITKRFGLEADAVMHAAREVGGDFYDVFQADEHEVAFVIGDVSGKGVPAALFMMRAQSLIKQHILTSANLGEAFTRANAALCEGNDAMLFVTAFACVVNAETGLVRTVNAGHNPPSARLAGVRDYLKCKPGLVLGAMDGVRYREAELQLSPGDAIMLYTDGVTEAFNATDELFGEQRLQRELERCDRREIERPAHFIEQKVLAFSAGVPQSDDITALSFSWHPYQSVVELPPEDEQLDRLFEFLKGVCDREHATPKALNDLMLVCEEMFVNVCHYGFPESARRMPVSFEAQVDEASRMLTLTMRDAGEPYNPLEYRPKKVVAGVDHRIGGLGILLMKENLDDVSYEYAGGRNVLHMKKNLDALRE